MLINTVNTIPSKKEYFSRRYLGGEISKCDENVVNDESAHSRSVENKCTSDNVLIANVKVPV